MSFQHLGVVGGGSMGSGIAEVGAKAGCTVTVVDVDNRALEAARQRIEVSTDRAVVRGKLTPQDRETALGRIAFEVDVAALAPCDLVVEAVAEDEVVKVEVFER